MSLVAAVRQGQLLPAQFAIHSPQALLVSLRDKGFLRASTEATEQYRQVAALRVGRLENAGSGWSRFVLIDRPENKEAVDMAIGLMSGSEPTVTPNDDIILSLRQGEKYVESLIGRKRVLQDTVVPIDEESRAAIDSFLLRGK